MSDFFNSYRSPQDTLFEGDKQHRSSHDLFEGDFYADDELVTRGLSFAPTFQTSADKKLLGLASRALAFPEEPVVDLEVKPVFAGKTYYSSATPTELATVILEYLNQLNSVVKLNPTKRSISAQVCKNYQAHKLRVSFYVPSDQDTVALTWERTAGDSVEFNSIVVGAEKAISDGGLSLTAVGMGSAQSSAFACPPMPQLFPEEQLSWGPGQATGELTPNFLDLPLLDVDPCTEEDLEPLLEMATSLYDGSSMAEAAAQLCRMVDGVTDAEVVAKVLGERPQVLFGLLNEPECVYAAPALVEKTFLPCLLNASDVAATIVERVSKEPGQLGKRQLAQCLNFVLSVAPGPTGFEGLLDTVQALDGGDEVTNRHLREATYSLKAFAC
jgi:hypothetical protein